MAKPVENLGTPTADEKPTRCLKFGLPPENRPVYLRLDSVVAVVDDTRGAFVYVAGRDATFLVMESAEKVLLALGWEVAN
jgi:hypothetical protein